MNTSVASAYECESTLKVPISAVFFNKVYKLISNKDPDEQRHCVCCRELSQILCKYCVQNNTDYNDTDRLYDVNESVILLFDDDSRLASRVYQTKRIESKTYVAVFCFNKFFPILRTRAVETMKPLPKSIKRVSKITKAVYRIILTKRKMHNVPDGVSIRFSFNKEEDSTHGVFYNMACETEYPANASYRNITYNENLMLNEYYDFIKLADIPMDVQTLNDLFATVVPKVQIWSCFNPELPYCWAYKWNGIKAKFMVKDGRILLWPDASTVQTLSYDGDLSAIDKIIFQVELMPTCVVLIHAISVSFFNKIYNIEPNTGITILNFLHDTLKNVFIHFENEPLPLLVQKFYNDQPCPKTFDADRYDGFIMAQDLLFIKWKQPTIDVEFMGNNTFKVGDDKHPILFTLDEAERSNDVCVKNGIYELSAKLSILRKRIDRLLCSTTKEYELFVKSVKLLNK